MVAQSGCACKEENGLSFCDAMQSELVVCLLAKPVFDFPHTRLSPASS